MENYQLVIDDATEAIKLQANFAKAYYRRGAAYCALNKWKEAVKDYGIACKLLPGNPEAKEKYDWANKEKKYREFGETLDYAFSIDKYDEEKFTVEPSYQGPVLNDIKELTADWIMNLIEYFKKDKVLHKRYLIKMIKQLIVHYKKQPTLIDVTIPDGSYITVCGDVHGQFYDLLNIFSVNGFPSPTNPYMFNGDFVDRGSFSVEVIVTLLSWNLLYPGSFFLNRGNHEAPQMNSLYGFQGEVKAKYDSDMYSLFNELFMVLPLCYLINKKIFV